uniref:Cobalamin biosynthesis protein n=1 Tax=Myoviridae sp. ctj3P51 TaxID=2826687 RepID=A0A8S5NNQ0_9CAUD|nr:MAG TPA: cobalamin biosynthesis protein [Myoviridae sp. ctj3P51]
MKPSVGYCQDVLKTLPVGYYLGHPVSLRLDPTGDTTYIELDCERVTVSYNNICAALKNAPDDIDPEPIIRALLYHEISHALLTPRNLFSNLTFHAVAKCCSRYKNYYDKTTYIWDHIHDIINIFEDERIETVCCDYYMNVDFKRLLILLNGDPKNFMDRDPVSKFFALVRYRIGPKAQLDTVSEIIKNFCGCTYTMPDSTGYAKCIIKLFASMLPFDFQYPRADNEQNSDTMQDAQDNSSKQNDQNDSAKDQTPPTPLTDDQIDALAQAIGEKLKACPIIVEKSQLKKAFKTLSTNREAAAIRAQFERVVQTALNRHKAQSSGSLGYSGRIDPRSTANKDYRWFAKKSQGSSVKRFSKIQFNLFCDDSGSFSSSRLKMNAVILALKELAATNHDIQVKVIHCGSGVTVPNQESPWLGCNAASYLSANLPTIYKDAQRPDATNINMVVFDGEFRIRDDFTKDKAFGTFNHPNCIIVSDTDNEEEFNNYAPQARKTFITEHYANTFISQLIDQVGRLLA